MKNTIILAKKAFSFLLKKGIKKTFYKILEYYKNSKTWDKYMQSNRLSKKALNYQKKYPFTKKCLFSITVPIYNTPEKLLREMIESVRDQTYQQWELCLADGSDKNEAVIEKICKGYAVEDKRVKYVKLPKNKGISGNTNECLKMAIGDYIVLLDHDDLLNPSALFENMLNIEESNADFLYSDELVFVDNPEEPLMIHFKPDFAIDNLRSNNYICHLTVFKRSLLSKIEAFRSGYDGSQDYDMILRLTEKAKKIIHIRKVLYFWRSHAGSVASDISVKSYCLDAAKKALNSCLERNGLQGLAIDSPAMSTYKINYEIFGEPLISVVIPFQKDLTSLYRGLKSLKKSQYKNFEVNIVYANNVEESIIAKVKDLGLKYKLIKFPDKYNYAKMCNYVSESVNGEYLLFFDENQSLLSENSIIELLMYAQRSDIGVVGSKLYNVDGKICHAGIVFAEEDAIIINGYGLTKDNLGYMGKLSYAQNISAVLLQGMMVKKVHFNTVGKFDPSLDKIMCGIKLSITMLEKGYLNVFTPFSEFELNQGLEKNLYSVAFAHDYKEKYYINRQYYA